MKSILIIQISIVLAGCIAYPSKHISDPAVDGKISDYEKPEVLIEFGDDPNKACESKLPYKKVSDSGEFFLPEKMSYIKFVYLVPTECSLSFLVCVKSKNGEVVSKRISRQSYPCNFEPPTIYIHCFRENETFDCR